MAFVGGGDRSGGRPQGWRRVQCRATTAHYTVPPRVGRPVGAGHRYRTIAERTPVPVNTGLAGDPCRDVAISRNRSRKDFAFLEKRQACSTPTLPHMGLAQDRIRPSGRQGLDTLPPLDRLVAPIHRPGFRMKIELMIAKLGKCFVAESHHRGISHAHFQASVFHGNDRLADDLFARLVLGMLRPRTMPSW